MLIMKFKTYILFSSDFKEAKEEVEKVGGEVIVNVTENIFLANIPSAFRPSQLVFSTHERPPKLDLVSNLMIEVWRQRKPKEIQELLGGMYSRNIQEIPEVTEIQNMELIR